MSISRPIATALAAAGLAGVLVFGLSACSPEPGPKPSPTPSASAEPIFASDEEALAAAVKAYEAYSFASAEVAEEGGTHPERIDEFVSEEFAATVHDEMEALSAGGGHLKGRLSFDTVSLVERNEGDGVATVSIYLCRDVSEVRAISSEGNDVTPGDRQERVASQAFFVSGPGQPTVLVVDGVDKWSGTDFC